MKQSELKDKNVDQLREDLSSFKKEAFNLRFQKASGQLENTARVRVVRRSIARILTILSSKEENV
jgi:large subunit ribosomal protein L29